MVHAVLDTHAPGVTIIDVTHTIAPHDIRAGALTLWRAAPWLAPAVILGVVDPGVGTERRAVAIEVADAGTVLVGPDNSLLLPAALHLGPVTQAVELPPDPGAPGATFHGRDIFAPAAGRAAAGVPLHQLGDPIDPATLAGAPVPEATADPAGSIDAEVLWVDHFGNAQLNATAAQLNITAAQLNAAAAHLGPGPLTVHTPGGTETMRIVASYGAIPPDDHALVIDSYGYLSISSNRRPAAAHLGLRPGDRVLLRPGDRVLLRRDEAPEPPEPKPDHHG